MSEQFSLEQAMMQLGCTRNTLKDWMTKCGIEGVPHKYNGRVRLISEEDVETIRLAMGDARRFIVAQPIKRPQRAIPSAGPVNLPPAPIAPPKSAHSASQGPSFPDGWVTVDSVRKEYGLHPATIATAEGRGYFKTTRGTWKKGRVVVQWALSPEEYQRFLVWVQDHRAKSAMP